MKLGESFLIIKLNPKDEQIKAQIFQKGHNSSKKSTNFFGTCKVTSKEIDRFFRTSELTWIFLHFLLKQLWRFLLFLGYFLNDLNSNLLKMNYTYFPLLETI